MDEEADSHERARSPGSWLWLLTAVNCGLIGPIFLSVLYVGFFRWPMMSSGVSGYPWSFPVWAYGITSIKLMALIVWMALGKRFAGLPSWAVGMLAGLFASVFAVGSAHAAGCVIMNYERVHGTPWTELNLILACLASLCYLWTSVLALLQGRRKPSYLLLGLLLGLLVAGLPLLPVLAVHAVL